MRFIKKLNQSGFDHIMGLVSFFVVFGIAGSMYLVLTHAQTPYFQLWLNKNNGICLNAASATNINTSGCSKGSDDLWERTSSGKNFQLRNEGNGGMCLEDSGPGFYQAKSGVAYRIQPDPLQLASCSNVPNQQWNWVGPGIHELQNRASLTASIAGATKAGGCINDLGASTSTGTQQVMYICNGSWNENWFEGSASNTSTATVNPAVAQCPNAVRSGVVFSESTRYPNYKNCVEAVQTLVNGIHANSTLTDLDLGSEANYSLTQAWPISSGSNATLLDVDGDYGALTAAAVTTAQKLANSLASGKTPYTKISVDGEVGPQTLGWLCYVNVASTNFSSNVNGTNKTKFEHLPAASAAGYNEAVTMFGKLSNNEPNCPSPFGSAKAL